MDFSEACMVVLESVKDQSGIGTLQEKTIHSVVKFYLEEDESLHEQKTPEGFVADILEPDGTIYEVQTGNFDRLRRKLQAFLPQHQVVVVYPIPAEKTVYWIQDTGEISTGHKSPKKTGPWDIFPELYKIRSFLSHPNLTLQILMINMEEYRLQDGWSKDGKRGSHRYDRIPLELVGEYVIETKEDYGVHFLPPTLPSEWTAKEYRSLLHTSERVAGCAMLLLREMQAIDSCGKRGRAYLYKRKEPQRE